MNAAEKSLNLRLHRASGWFALCAFAAYLIVTPIHMATVAHCLQPKVHPPSDCCDHQHESSSEKQDDRHEHHSAVEHVLNAVKHDPGLAAVDFVWMSGAEVAPVRAADFLAARTFLSADFSSSPPPSFGSRAPPCA